MENNLDTTKPRYSNHVLPVPWRWRLIHLMLSECDAKRPPKLLQRSWPVGRGKLMSCEDHIQTPTTTTTTTTASL